MLKTSLKSICIIGLLLLSACADLNIQNPFEPAPQVSSSDTYIDQFAEIPIPVDMRIDRAKSFNNANNGVLYSSGQVEINSLNNAMLGNMANNGWKLIATVKGAQTLQVYEKGSLYAVITTYESAFATNMDIWLTTRLGNSFQNNYPNTIQSVPSTTTPSFPSDTNSGVTSQGLSN